jgi:pectin methylesterase-like acyl-CoA thioesterase
MLDRPRGVGGDDDDCDHRVDVGIGVSQRRSTIGSSTGGRTSTVAAALPPNPAPTTRRGSFIRATATRECSSAESRLTASRPLLSSRHALSAVLTPFVPSLGPASPVACSATRPEAVTVSPSPVRGSASASAVIGNDA